MKALGAQQHSDGPNMVLHNGFQQTTQLDPHLLLPQVGASRPLGEKRKASKLVTYSAFDNATMRQLTRPGADDVYVRPLLSVLEDDESGDHERCLVCRGPNWGDRWVPNNGGAWVIPALWEESGRDPEKYTRMIDAAN